MVNGRDSALRTSCRHRCSCFVTGLGVVGGGSGVVSTTIYMPLAMLARAETLHERHISLSRVYMQYVLMQSHTREDGESIPARPGTPDARLGWGVLLLFQQDHQVE